MRARAPRWPQPDFMPAAQRPGLLMWLWLAVSLGVLLTLALHLIDQRAEAGELDDQAAQLQHLALRSRPAAVAASAQANPEAERRAWAIADQLAIDWRSRWLGLEQALPPGLQMQALDIDSGQALRLEGLADSMEPVTLLADRLAVQARESEDLRGSQVELTRLQRADDAQPLRFEIVRRRAGARAAS